MQAGDFIAWHLANYMMTKTPFDHAGHVLEKFRKIDATFREMNMTDPARITAALEIPRREPERSYKFRVLSIRGKRIAVTSSRLKNDASKERKLDRNNIVLVEPKIKTLDELKAVLDSYDRDKLKANEANA